MLGSNAPNCGREDDLVGFLYGELSELEKQSFKTHLDDCHLCGEQVNELGSVRESIIAWRKESLAGVYAGASAPVRALASERRSALTALRAFFDLSPLWMKGAIGFAAILFCMITVLAFVQWRAAGTSPPQASKTGTYSPDQLNKMVEQRVQEELARQTNPPPLVPTSPNGEVVANNQGRSVKPIMSRHLVSRDNQIHQSQRPLSRSERAQLAADLRLVSVANERGLDLLEDQINQ